MLCRHCDSSQWRDSRYILFSHQARTRILQLLVLAGAWFVPWGHRRCPNISWSVEADRTAHRGFAFGGTQQAFWWGLSESGLPSLSDGLSRLWVLWYALRFPKSISKVREPSIAHCGCCMWLPFRKASSCIGRRRSLRMDSKRYIVEAFIFALMIDFQYKA